MAAWQAVLASLQPEQRTPEYLDGAMPPETAPAALESGSPNARFGRRFQVVAFRWISPEDV